MNKDTTERRWKFKDLLGALRNSLMAILKGEFLLRLNVGRYFPHIVYIFFVFSLVIWASLLIDSSMTRIEEGKKTIATLEMEGMQKKSELVRLTGRGAVKARLLELGSPLEEPQVNAILIGK